MPTISEIFSYRPFKIFFLASLLALDLNRVARTSRVFKIGIEREFVISVEARVFIKNKFRTIKKYLTKKLSVCPCL